MTYGSAEGIGMRNMRYTPFLYMKTFVDCIADTHIPPVKEGGGPAQPDPDSDAYFPGALNQLSPEERERRFRDIWEEVRLAYTTSLDWLNQCSHDKHDGPIHHLGDVCTSYSEQGVNHPRIAEVARKVVTDLKNLGRPIYFCIGNHDAGYEDPEDLSSKHASIAGIEACKEIYGDLFWKHKIGDVLSVGICSAIAEHDGSDPRIQKQKREQAMFIGDSLRDSRNKGGPWVLYSHEPESIRHFGKEMQPYLPELSHLISGDKHDSRWGGRYRKAFSLPGLGILPGRNWQARVRGFRNLSIVPSVAPLWCKGYGAMTVTYDGAAVSPNVVQLSRPPASRNLPESSFITALWERCQFDLMKWFHRK